MDRFKNGWSFGFGNWFFKDHGYGNGVFQRIPQKLQLHRLQLLYKETPTLTAKK
jgi:hypothetical protein